MWADPNRFVSRDARGYTITYENCTRQSAIFEPPRISSKRKTGNASPMLCEKRACQRVYKVPEGLRHSSNPAEQSGTLRGGLAEW